MLCTPSSTRCNSRTNFLFFTPSLLSILFCTGNLSWPCIHCWVINPPIWAEMLNVLVWFWLDKSLGLKNTNLTMLSMALWVTPVYIVVKWPFKLWLACQGACVGMTLCWCVQQQTNVKIVFEWVENKRNGYVIVCMWCAKALMYGCWC